MIYILPISAPAKQILWGNGDPGALENSVGYGWTYRENLTMDLLAYAREYAVLRGASWNSVSIFLAANNAFGWRMRYYVPAKNRWITLGFAMTDVAKWQGRKRGFDSWPTSMRNWGVYVLNRNNPHSWRAAYWLNVFR
jgi:hypothetical protein